MLPACRSIDCVSVFALTVEDAAAVLAVIEGDDPFDAYSRFVPGAGRLPAALRIGIPSHAEFHGDAGYAAAFEVAVAQVSMLGHRPVATDFANLHAVAELLYSGPWVAERFAVVEALIESNPGALDPSVRQVIEAARGFSAADAFRGQYELAGAKRAVAKLWDQVDLLMVPTAPGHPKHAEVDAEPLRSNAQLGLYTNYVNLLGWCALALPAGFTTIGLPFGVTFIAPAGADAGLARFGVTWQASLGLRLGATQRLLAEAASAGSQIAPDGPLWPASIPTMPIAVVGAHLSGLPLNSQLTDRGAVLRETARTAPHYRLYALADTTPPKPGMLRVGCEGAAIEVEVWEMPQGEVGAFLALVPAPLGIGKIELEDGRWVHGFVCEAHALQSAPDVTRHGGWRAYLQSLPATSAS